MKLFKGILNWLGDTGRVFRREMNICIRDAGLMLFFVALPLAYPIVYTLIYNPEVVEKIPVAVVDESHTAQSRELARKMSACPAIEVYSYPANMADAKIQMAEGEVFGVLQIPHDYAKKLARGEQAVVPFYSDMSLLLRYRAFVSALTDLQIELATSMTQTTIAQTPLSALTAGRDVGLPVKNESNFLGDTEQGFASFVIPGIVILILQQSMILGITLLGGTSRERRRRNGGIDPKEVAGSSVSATVWGRALCYVVFYIPSSIYILHWIPEMFNLPHYGSPVDYLLFIFPMLLATAFLGQFLNILMKERESAFIIIVFTSVVFLFLSGLTWPRYAMNDFWTWAGNTIPAVWGVEGFIRINSNAATLAESSRPYIALWILTAIYLLGALWTTAYIRAKSRSRTPAKA